MRQLFILIAAVLAIIFNLNTAFAQDTLRERARSVEIDGTPYYRLRAQVNEPFSHLTDLAAPGVTEDQIDAVNIGYVNYVCRIDGQRRIPPTRNGRFGDEGVEPTIDFATFASTRCTEGEARRELVAGSVYLVPREVIRTPGELLGDITAQITDAPPDEVAGVIRDTRTEARALIARSVSGDVVNAYMDAVNAGIDRLPDTTTVATATDTPTDPDELSAANARITELEAALDAANARAPSAPASGFWSVSGLGILLAIAVLVIFILIFTPRRKGPEAIINLTDDERREIEAKAEAKWKKKLETAQTQLKPVLDEDANLKALRAVQSVYLTRMGEVMNDKNFEETLNDARAYRDDWKRIVKGYTVKGLTDALSNAKVFERMEKAFNVVFGHLTPPVAFGEYAFAGLQARQEAGLAALRAKHDADLTALDESFKQDLSNKDVEIANRDARVQELVGETIALREQLGDSVQAAAQVVAKELDALLFGAPWYREDLRGLTARHEATGARNIDYDTVVRKFGIPVMVDGRRWKKSDILASRQKTLDLYQTWLKIYEGLNKLTSRVDELAGRKAASDHTPPPGTHPVEKPLTMPPPAAVLSDLGDEESDELETTNVGGRAYEPESDSTLDRGEPTVITSLAALADKRSEDATTRVVNLGPDGEPVRTGKTLMGLPAAPRLEASNGNGSNGHGHEEGSDEEPAPLAEPAGSEEGEEAPASES